MLACSPPASSRCCPAINQVLMSFFTAGRKQISKVCVCMCTVKDEGASKHGFKISLSPVAVQRNERSASR